MKLFREKYLFFLLVCINASPLFVGKYFPTMDGPAHLYNANLIWELISSNNEILTGFYILNPELVPNWLGHFILLIGNRFLPPFLAEKLILGIYLFSFPYLFRKLVLQTQPSNILMSYLGLLFVYSQMFLLGFYNFSLGILLMLLTLYFWTKLQAILFTKKGYFIFSGLFLLLYFSHLFVFGLTLAFIGIKIVSRAIAHKKKTILFREALLLLSFSIIPLVLALRYFSVTPSLTDPTYLPKGELLTALIEMKSLIGFDHSFESTVLTITFAIFFLLFIASLILSLKSKSFQKDHFIVWVSFSLLILFMYFLFPNTGGSAGMISVRLNYLFFLFAFLAIASFPFPIKLAVLPIMTIIGCSFLLTTTYVRVIYDLNKAATEYEKAAYFIPENSTILPLNFSYHWLMPHFSNYLGVNKSQIIFDNYEASVNYFPVKMNHATYPNVLLGHYSIDDLKCANWLSIPYAENTYTPDFILLQGAIGEGEGDCGEIIASVLETEYNLVYHNSKIKLYKTKG